MEEREKAMLLEGIPVLRDLTIWSILLRTALSLLFSGILGYDREKKGRPAGIRTYMVVCVGSALAMMTGIYLTDMTGTGDASRIAAQVICGIGFLGAGTILVTKQRQVKGLTTAAGLWAAACIGLALGAGFYSGAIIGFAAVLGSLWTMQIVDRRLHKNSESFTIYVEFSGMEAVSRFLTHARTQNCTVSNLEIKRTKNENGSMIVTATMTLRFKFAISHTTVIETYGALEGVQFIEEM